MSDQFNNLGAQVGRFECLLPDLDKLEPAELTQKLQEIARLREDIKREDIKLREAIEQFDSKQLSQQAQLPFKQYYASLDFSETAIRFTLDEALKASLKQTPTLRK